MLYRILKLFLIFSCSFIFAKEDIDISSSYYISSKKITIDEVKKINSFILSKGNNFGISKNYYWLKLQIKNKTKENKKIFIKFKTPFIDYITVYKADKIEKLGQLNPYNKNIKSLNNAAFKVNINKFEEKTIYLELKGSFAIKTSFEYFLEETYEEDLIFKKRLFDFIYGILVSMLLYNFFIWINIRQKAYFYYVAFHFIFFLGIISWTGFAFECLWNDYPQINYYTYGILGNLIYALNILFIIYYLESYKYLAKTTKLLKICAYFFIFLAFSSIFIQLVLLYEIVSFIASFLTLLVIVYLILKYNLKAAKYIFIAKILLITGNFLIIISEFGFIQGGFYVDNSYIWGFSVEVILMSFALSYKFKDLEIKMKIEQIKRKETENMLLAEHKLLTIGGMMNKLIHQYRQPLGEINALVCSIENDYKHNKLNEKRLSSKIDNIELITNYLSNTIEDFRNFFLEGKKEESYLSDIINNSLSIMNSSFKNINIKINFNKNEDKKVLLNRNQLLQVLLIVLTNAKDAIEEKQLKNGEIFISLKNEKQFMLINIANNAGKIKKEIQDKIFNANFTTKNNKKGTGLGLYLAKLIIKDKLKGDIFLKMDKDITSFILKIKT